MGLIHDIEKIAAELPLLRKELMSTKPLLQGLQASLNSLGSTITDTLAPAVTKLDADVDSLIAKLSGGGTITAEDLAPLQAQTDALNTGVAALAANIAAEDAKANPPVPPAAPAAGG